MVNRIIFVHYTISINHENLFIISRHFIVFSLSIQAGDLKLWYKQPAGTWVEALPVGNSRMGAMVYGGTAREELQLNDETMWGGSPYRNDKPEALESLPQVRELIFAGKNMEAQNLIQENFYAGKHGMPYQTIGSLIIETPDMKRLPIIIVIWIWNVRWLLPVTKWMA